MIEPADREEIVTASRPMRSRPDPAEYPLDVERQRDRLADMVEEYRKREKSQDRIRNLLTVERDEARADLDTIARTCDNLLFAIGQGSFNPAEKWLLHDFGYLRDIARGDKT